MKKYYYSIFSMLLAIGLVSFQSTRTTVLYFIGGDIYCLLDKEYYTTNPSLLPTECDSGLDLPCRVFMPEGVISPEDFIVWLDSNYADDINGKLAYIYNHASKREAQLIIGDN